MPAQFKREELLSFLTKLDFAEGFKTDLEIRTYDMEATDDELLQIVEKFSAMEADKAQFSEPVKEEKPVVEKKTKKENKKIIKKVIVIEEQKDSDTPPVVKTIEEEADLTAKYVLSGNVKNGGTILKKGELIKVTNPNFEFLFSNNLLIKQ